ncbi:phage holin family protein [Deinococcus pimensis]|uniref:phage holin family protein n=1 Tax=Deinococcus pimensis TaxID=309888 RepID=UPI0004883ABE|nr:phage holin family protein [Deinococcus pimensis]
MRSILIKIVVNALALWITTLVYSGVRFENGGTAWDALVAGLVLGIVNALIRPVLLLFSLPATILTLGLFTLVINGVVLWIVASLTSLAVSGFTGALVGALVLAVVSWLLDLVLHRVERRAA